MYNEKTTVRYYLEDKKVSEKYTSLIPRDGDTVVINGKAYTVREVVWFDDVVEVYVERTAGSALIEDSFGKR